MKHRTRIDAVVKLRERDEDKARRELAEAQRQARAAEQALRDAELRARQETRAGGSAAHWELADHAHARALLEARHAEHAARAASDRLGSTRAAYAGVHARAEAMRRLAEARRAELLAQYEQAERRSLDELAVMMYGRN